MSDGKKLKCCEVCGQSLEGLKHRRTYCSDACMRKAKVKKKYRNLRTHVCQTCGKMFETPGYRVKYCSDACREQKKAELGFGQFARKEERGDRVLLRVKKEIDVVPALRPQVGKVYEGRRYWMDNHATLVIPEIGKFGLIVRQDEVAVVEG